MDFSSVTCIRKNLTLMNIKFCFLLIKGCCEKLESERFAVARIVSFMTIVDFIVCTVCNYVVSSVRIESK